VFLVKNREFTKLVLRRSPQKAELESAGGTEASREGRVAGRCWEGMLGQQGSARPGDSSPRRAVPGEKQNPPHELWSLQRANEQCGSAQTLVSLKKISLYNPFDPSA